MLLALVSMQDRLCCYIKQYWRSRDIPLHDTDSPKDQVLFGAKLRTWGNLTKSVCVMLGGTNLCRRVCLIDRLSIKPKPYLTNRKPLKKDKNKT